MSVAALLVGAGFDPIKERTDDVDSLRACRLISQNLLQPGDLPTRLHAMAEDHFRDSLALSGLPHKNVLLRAQGLNFVEVFHRFLAARQYDDDLIAQHFEPKLG